VQDFLWMNKSLSHPRTFERFLRVPLKGELSIDSSRILSMSYYIFNIVLGTRKFSTLTKRYLLSIRETDTKNRETREEVFEAEARYEPQ
jgi:hypothetical protein